VATEEEPEAHPSSPVEAETEAEASPTAEEVREEADVEATMKRLLMTRAAPSPLPSIPTTRPPHTTTTMVASREEPVLVVLLLRLELNLKVRAPSTNRRALLSLTRDLRPVAEAESPRRST